MRKTYKTNKNVVYSCKYHVVFCPKWRRPVLVPPIDEQLKSIITGVISFRKAELLEMEILPDHVHLLVEVDPQYGIHRLVKQMKGASSRMLRAEYPLLRKRIPTLWSNSYFVSTVGGAPLDTIKQYIESQKRE